jgi:hypothetical protein
MYGMPAPVRRSTTILRTSSCSFTPAGRFRSNPEGRRDVTDLLDEPVWIARYQREPDHAAITGMPYERSGRPHGFGMHSASAQPIVENGLPGIESGELVFSGQRLRDEPGTYR